MPALVSTTVVSSRLVAVVADSNIADENLSVGSWVVTSDGAPVAVTGVVLLPGELSVLLDLSPALEFGTNYTLTHPTLTGSVGWVGPVFDGGEITLGTLEAMTEAFGEMFHFISGEPTTRLTRSFKPGDTTISVENASEFPNAFEGWLGGKRVKVRSVDPSTTLLRGVTDLTLDGQFVPPMESITLDPTSLPFPEPTQAVLSATTRALWDTLIHRADGEALDDLGVLYGLERPLVFEQSAWRGLLHSAAFGARGTPGVLWESIASLFRPLEREFKVSLDPALPNTLTFVESVGDRVAFMPCDLERWVEVRFIPLSAAGFDDTLPVQEWPWEKRVFWSEGPFLDAASTSPTLELSQVKTSYWEACNWAGGDLGVDPAHPEAWARVLRFVMTEPGTGRQDPLVYPGSVAKNCTVVFYSDLDLVDVPDSYLLDPAGVDRSTIAPNPPPPGSILMDEFNLDDLDPAPPPDSDPDNGLAPLYLQEGTSGVLARVAKLLLPLGFWVEEFDSGSSTCV